MLKKNLLSVVLILSLATCFVGCGNDDKKATTSTTTTATEVESTSQEETTTDETENTTDEVTSDAITEEVTTETSTTKPTEVTTQKPVETTTQKPTQKPTQITTQKPTQKPTETTTQKPTESKKEYELSSKGYDFIVKWTDNLYITKTNNKYGVINEKGETVIPFNYDSIKISNESRSELALSNGNNCVVYDKNLKKVVEYTGHLNHFTNGMLIQRETIPGTDEEDPFPPLKLTIKNVYTGKVLFTDTVHSYPSGVSDFELISKSNFDASIMVWKMDPDSDYDTDYQGTVTIVTPNGNKKIDRKVSSSYKSYYTNGVFYNLFSIDSGACYQLNLNTNELYDVENNFSECKDYYFGNGNTYAVTKDGTNYTIYKGNKALTSKQYTWLEFDKNCIIAGDSTITHILDYNGKILKTFNDVDVDEYNGKRLVYDGVGVYYVDSSYNKVSDYIVEGTGLSVSGGSIKINGKWYYVK